MNFNLNITFQIKVSKNWYKKLGFSIILLLPKTFLDLANFLEFLLPLLLNFLFTELTVLCKYLIKKITIIFNIKINSITILLKP